MTAPKTYQERIAQGLCGRCGLRPIAERSGARCTVCLDVAAKDERKRKRGDRAKSYSCGVCGSKDHTSRRCPESQITYSPKRRPMPQLLAGVQPLLCAMVDQPGSPPCGDVARRLVVGVPGAGCCDDCFEDMARAGDWAPGELEADYPLRSKVTNEERAST